MPRAMSASFCGIHISMPAAASNAAACMGHIIPDEDLFKAQSANVSPCMSPCVPPCMQAGLPHTHTGAMKGRTTEDPGATASVPDLVPGARIGEGGPGNVVVCHNALPQLLRHIL